MFGDRAAVAVVIVLVLVQWVAFAAVVVIIGRRLFTVIEQHTSLLTALTAKVFGDEGRQA
jgi:hypothetical protein